MKKDEHENEGVALKKSAIGTGVFFLIALLLDATSLETNARNMEFGAVRDFCVRLVSPVAGFSRLCRFDVPRRLASGVRERFMDKVK